MRVVLRDGAQVLIRPIEPQDAQREQAFVRGLSPESRYFRFMNTLRELSPEMLERFTHPDAAREIALVATTADAAQQIGVARCAALGERHAWEFAIVVADAWQGRGLGSHLMRELIEAARARGVPRLEGLVLSENHRMLMLMHALGFDIGACADDARVRRVAKSLH